MLIGAVLPILLAGCGAGAAGLPATEGSQVEAVSPAQAAIEASGLVDWTLDRNLSRADVGLVDGRRTVAYSSPSDGDPYRARLTLPNAIVVETTISSVLVQAALADDQGQPCDVVAATDFMTAAEAEAFLTERRETLGLAADAITRWRELADQVTAGSGSGAGEAPGTDQDDGPGALTLVAASADHVMVSIEGSATPGRDQVRLFLYFSWCDA